MKDGAVFAIYGTQTEVEHTIDLLRAEGFRNTDISVLCPEEQRTNDFTDEIKDREREGDAAGGRVTRPRGALGWLGGIGTLAVPGAGPLIAAGPIMAALSGIPKNDGDKGVARALIETGVPEHEANRYEAYITGGGIMISVRCDDPVSAEKAKAILATSGGKDVASATQRLADQQIADRPMHRAV